MRDLGLRYDTAAAAFSVSCADATVAKTPSPKVMATIRTLIHDIAAASAGLHATKGEAPGRRTDAVYLARLAARAVSLYACAFALTRSVEAAGGKQHPLAWAPLLAVVQSAVDGASCSSDGVGTGNSTGETPCVATTLVRCLSQLAYCHCNGCRGVFGCVLCVSWLFVIDHLHRGAFAVAARVLEACKDAAKCLGHARRGVRGECVCCACVEVRACLVYTFTIPRPPGGDVITAVINTLCGVSACLQGMARPFVACWRH